MLLEMMRTNSSDYEELGKTFNNPTGFTIVDILSGGSLELDTDFEPFFNCGLPNKFHQMVGPSSSGKTTFMIQLMASSATWWNNRYPEVQGSDFIIYDSEDNTTLTRFQELTNWDSTYLHNHLSLRKTVDINDIFNQIRKFADYKKNNKNKYYVTTDVRDINGDFVKTWIPTFILIDSVAALKAKTDLESLDRDKEGQLKEVEQISGNMDAMHMAREITNFVTKIKPLLNQYGIVLFLINHIVQSPSINPYDIPKRLLLNLKPGERLLGGNESIYQSFAIGLIRSKEKLDDKNPAYGNDLHGSINEFTYIKSKNHGEGIVFRMVFSPRYGFLPELSDFETLQSHNYGLGGSPIGLFLKILPEIKFTRKTLFESCHKYPILARALQFTAKLLLIYKITLDTDPIDIDSLASLPYEKRVTLIWSYTSRYPGYGNESLNEELENIIMQGRVLMNMQKDYSSSVINNIILSMLIPQQEGEVPMSPFGYYYYPKELMMQDPIFTINDAGTTFNFYK